MGIPRALVASPDVTQGRSPVVRRIWGVVPELRRDGSLRPLLTGILGFPWRGPTLDAKCTIIEPDRGHLGGVYRGVDRHHRVIPDPACSCGIYATDDPDRTVGRVLRGRPVVSGFVELAGRVLRDGPVLRAQRARMVGPLTIDLGRPPLAFAVVARSARPPHPRRVSIEGGAYRVAWGWGSDRTGSWLVETARALEERYGLEVLHP